MSRTKSLILGASSGVGRALSYYLTSLNQDIFLCSRGLRDLEAMASDISAKYSVQVNYKNIDLSNTAEVDDLFNSIDINDFSEIYITIGKVVSIDNGEQPFTTVSELMETNYIAPVRIINKIFQNYTQLKSLKILIISSIAVSRPRGQNIVYAASKSALDFYCQGLQHKLSNSKLSLHICRLGYVDTEMSYGKKMLFPVASPASAAIALHKAMKNNKAVFYYPGFWKLIHLIVNSLPWFIYKRLKF